MEQRSRRETKEWTKLGGETVFQPWRRKKEDWHADKWHYLEVLIRRWPGKNQLLVYIILIYSYSTLYMMSCHITVLLAFYSLPLYHRSFWRVMEGVFSVMHPANRRWGPAGLEDVTGPDEYEPGTSNTVKPQTPQNWDLHRWMLNMLNVFLGDGTSQVWSELVLLEILGKWNFWHSWSEWSICRVKVWADVNEKFSKRWVCRGERNVVYRLGVLEVG